MKSNRMRLFKPVTKAEKRKSPAYLYRIANGTLNLEEVPPPLPVARISPDKIIEDILIATLRRVQNSAAPEIAAAAARYVTVLSQETTRP